MVWAKIYKLSLSKHHPKSKKEEIKMNRTTKFIAATLGVILATSGMSHGFFEALQGSTPTPGLIINAVSESMQTWLYGSEMALTIIPNFLITGLAAMGVSLAIVVWSLRFLDTRHGATVLLALFIALFLVGGGIAQLPFFLVVWAFATRINQPLTWWRRVLPAGVRGALARIWPWTLAASTLLFLFALQIAIFGFVPGVEDADQRLSIVFASLSLGMVCIILSFVSGFAYDLRQQPEPRLTPARIG
jgi:hypothetical protein